MSAITGSANPNHIAIVDFPLNAPTDLMTAIMGQKLDAPLSKEDFVAAFPQFSLMKDHDGNIVLLGTKFYGSLLTISCTNSTGGDPYVCNGILFGGHPNVPGGTK